MVTVPVKPEARVSEPLPWMPGRNWYPPEVRGVLLEIKNWYAALPPVNDTEPGVTPPPAVTLPMLMFGLAPVPPNTTSDPSLYATPLVEVVVSFQLREVPSQLAVEVVVVP